MEPPVSLPSEYGTVPAATVAALPPLLPPGTRSTSHGLPTEPNAEFSVDEPMANSSQLVLPTHTAPASNNRCTAVPVYGGLYPLRIFDAAVVSVPSTQSTSLSAIGMPHSGDAVSGCSASIFAAASACSIARSRVTLRYALRFLSHRSRCASVASSNARGVVEPSRSAAASSVMVLAVELIGLYSSCDKVIPVGRRSVAQRGGRAERWLRYIGAHHVDKVTDLGRFGEHR